MIVSFWADIGGMGWELAPLISSSWPLGVPSWSLPLMQHEDIPTPVDIVVVEFS